MSAPAPPPATRPRRWLVAALVVSLGLNLATAGFVIGLAVAGPPPGRGGEVGLWRYGAALPEPFRRDLGRELRAGPGAWRETRRALRGQREALAAALRAEPYDPGAAAAALAAERAMLGELAERGAALLLAQIARMSPEERRAYADALERPRRGGRPDRE